MSWVSCGSRVPLEIPNERIKQRVHPRGRFPPRTVATPMASRVGEGADHADCG